MWLNNLFCNKTMKWHIIKCVVDYFVYFLCVLPSAFRQHFTRMSTGDDFQCQHKNIYLHMRRMAAAVAASAQATKRWNQCLFPFAYFPFTMRFKFLFCPNGRWYILRIISRIVSSRSNYVMEIMWPNAESNQNVLQMFKIKL